MGNPELADHLATLAIYARRPRESLHPAIQEALARLEVGPICACNPCAFPRPPRTSVRNAAMPQPASEPARVFCSGAPCICPPLPARSAPPPEFVYRVGAKVGRTIYCNDMLIGVMDLAFDAARVVALLNESLIARGPTEQVAPAHDPINNPSHYQLLPGVEVLDIIEALNLGYHLGNVAKYLLRAGRKDSAKRLEDLKKARYYLDRKIGLLEGGK